MDIFLKNYWSLYLNFLNDFEKLKYRGFSLPYLCHLPSFVINNSQIWNKLSENQLTESFKNKVRDQKEFQEAFNQFVRSHEKKGSVQSKYGKVVVHVDKLLRFPPNTFKYFSPSNTIKVISLSKKNEKKMNSTILKNKLNNSIPIYYLNTYSSNIEKEVIQLQNQAEDMIQSFKEHDLYMDVNFQTWFLKKIVTIVEQIDMSYNFLQDVSVSCIVVSSTHSYISRILALVAAEEGIPTICMQHGIISSELGYIPKIATIDAVYGNFELDWYKRLGVPTHSLEIIGHPRFDQAFTRSTITRNKFNSSLRLDPKKKTLMIVVRDKSNMDSWRILIQTISKKLALNVLIKNYPSKQPHPLTKEFPFVHSTQHYSLYDIFPNVDAVAAYSSTVGLEAMIANKSVFILEERFIGYTGYYSILGKLVQTDPSKLGEIILKYFTNPQFKTYAVNQRRKFLRYMYPDTSNSGERLVNVINRITR